MLVGVGESVDDFEGRPANLICVVREYGAGASVAQKHGVNSGYEVVHNVGKQGYGDNFEDFVDWRFFQSEALGGIAVEGVDLTGEFGDFIAEARGFGRWNHATAHFGGELRLQTFKVTGEGLA